MANLVATAEERRLLGRAGFGISNRSLEQLRSKGWEAYVQWQLQPDPKDDPELLPRMARTALKIEYGEDNGRPAVKEYRGLKMLHASEAELWKLLDEGSPGNERPRPIHEVRAATSLRAVYSQWQVLELMADFWHNHFNVYPWEDETMQVVFPVYDRETIRAHALGNFRTMLESVAQSVPMLRYLNNASSKASPANETYARELFELHTLGADAYLNHLYNRWREVPGAIKGQPEGYIDQDVYEAARAFTGWTIGNGDDDGHGSKFPQTGRFYYAANWHDPYQKRVLAVELDANQPPLTDGRAVLDVVAAHPATARHLATKLCRRLLADDPPQALIDHVAMTWLETVKAPDQIAQVLKVILMCADMKSLPETKVKRPFELAVSFLRATAAEFRPGDPFHQALENCGHPLFGWLTPTGFPDMATYWLSSRFIINRWNLLWDLTRGEMDSGKIDVLAVAQKAEAVSPRAFAKFWANQFGVTSVLARPEEEKKFLEKCFADFPFDEPMDPLAMESRQAGSQAVALLASAPGFQRR